MAKKKKQEKLTDIHDIKECPDCASQNIVYNEERQQVICRDCGLIYEPLTPEAEKQFVSSHELMQRGEAPEKIMIRLAEEKPKKRSSRKKAKPKKAKKKAAKKKVKKKIVKNAKKKPAKKKAKKKIVKKKAAKKKAVKKKAPKKKRSLIGHIRARLKKKR